MSSFLRYCKGNRTIERTAQRPSADEVLLLSNGNRPNNYDIDYRSKQGSNQHSASSARLSFSSQESPDRDDITHLYYCNGANQNVVKRKHAHVHDQQQPAYAELRNIQQPANGHSRSDASWTILHKCRLLKAKKRPPLTIRERIAEVTRSAFPLSDTSRGTNKVGPLITRKIVMTACGTLKNTGDFNNAGNSLLPFPKPSPGGIICG
jgi:hypothetical protein